MWAIAKHILYQGRQFLWLLLFTVFGVFFMEHPFWMYNACLLICIFSYIFWQSKNIKVYRTLPISNKQVANMGWLTCVIGVQLWAFVFIITYCLGRSYHSAQNFLSEINFSTILQFFFLFVSSTSLIFTIIASPTLYYRLKFDPHPAMSRNKYVLLIFVGLLYYSPLIVLLLDSPPIWGLFFALLAGLLSLYASWNVTGKIFINGWFWEEGIDKSSSPSTFYQNIGNEKETMFPRYLVIFGPIKFYVLIWLVYFLGIRIGIISSIIDLFNSVDDPLSFCLPLFIAIILLFNAFNFSMRVLPILLLLPVHRILLVFYLLSLPVLSILIGIALGMISDFLFPNTTATDMHVFYLLAFLLLLIPFIWASLLRFGHKGVFMALIPCIAYFIVFTNQELMLETTVSGVNCIFFGISAFIACLSSFYVGWFLKKANKVPVLKL